MVQNNVCTYSDIVLKFANKIIFAEYIHNFHLRIFIYLLFIYYIFMKLKMIYLFNVEILGDPFLKFSFLYVINIPILISR